MSWIVERLGFHGTAASNGGGISGVWILGRDRMVCGLSVGLKGGRRGQGIYGLSAGVWHWLDGVEEEFGTAGESSLTPQLQYGVKFDICLAFSIKGTSLPMSK